MKGRDFALLTDLYELTMMQGSMKQAHITERSYSICSIERTPAATALQLPQGCSRRLNIWMGCILQRRILHIWKA